MGVVKPERILELLSDDLIPASQRERARLDDIDRWLTIDNPVEVFRKAHQPENAERSALGRLSYTPILRLVVDECAQQMDLDGAYSPGRSTDTLWEPWERNGMPSRQGALWAASIGYGYAYTATVPGFVPGDLTRAPRAVIRTYSPREFYAVYGDVVEDEWPLYGLRTIGKPARPTAYRFIDEEAEHFIGVEDDGRLVYVEGRPHGAGVPPVVCWANGMDLEGRTPGEVEKFKVPAQRFLKTTEDRILIQHHNSWRVRTATGLEDPGSPEEKDRQKVKLAHDDVLTGGEGVTFGSLPETQMDGILKAADADRDAIAALSQTPVWALNGGHLVNLSADALVEARSMSRLKIRAKQRSMGRAAAQNLRLAAHIEGRADDAADFSLRMQWADVESRSMAQAADALGKIAKQLEVPVQMLWEMIPGVTSTKVKEWREFADQNPSDQARLADAVERLGAV